MAESDFQERTEQATPKRLKEAREKGQVPRSRELSTMCIMVAAAISFLLFGQYFIEQFTTTFSKGFSIDRVAVFDSQNLIEYFGVSVAKAMFSFAPFFFLMLVVAVMAPLLLGGWAFSTKALEFKTEKLNPIKGLKKVFARRGLVEMIKALLKFTLIGALAVVFLLTFRDELLALGAQSVHSGLGHLGKIMSWAFLLLCFALVIVALIDAPFQLWDHKKQLKMTRQQVKDESKETEGRPEVKRKVRTLQMEMARRRMMAEVSYANAVIVNPDHYAVAVRYDQDKMDVPIVVAKGADLVALQIRKIARENDIPIVSAPPLARAIFYSTELNQEIPAGLYLAVAQVLAFVFQLKRNHRYFDDEYNLGDLPIPEDLQHD